MSDIDSRVDELEKTVELLESKLRNVNRAIDVLEEQMANVDEENELLKDQFLENSDIAMNSLSDAERVMLYGWGKATVQKTKNRERAIHLLEVWENESYRTKGETLRTLPFKTIVEDEIADISYYSAMERVAEFTEEMTDGKFTIETTGMQNPSSDEVTVIAQYEELVRDVTEL